VFINSGSTHNFIQRQLAQEMHYPVQPLNNFQILIVNGSRMKCGGRCENVKLEMGEYHLKSQMFTIEMNGCYIVLGVEWLRNLGDVTMYFKEL